MDRLQLYARTAFSNSWRPISGMPWLFAGLLFFLPWVSVSCNAPNAGHKVFATQSGFQAIYGGHTIPPVFQAEIERVSRGEPIQPRGLLARCSPLMAVYLCLLVFGFALALGLEPGQMKTMVILLTCSALLILIIVQTALGFPIERRLTDPAFRQFQQAPDVRAPRGFQFFEPKPDEARMLGALLVDVNYTVWFWIQILAVCVGGGMEFVVWRVAHSPSRGRPISAIDGEWGST